MVTPRFFTGATPVLVGREREQLALHDHLAAAFAGHGSLMLVGGEAGIGKTTLAESVCNAAQAQGALVLIGRCYDMTETPPYGPWVELFGHYQRADGPPLPTAFAERGTVGEVTSQVTLFQQMQDFFTLLAMQRPLILLLDDLHWADPASLDLLRFLARSLATLPLLIVVTYRNDELTGRHALYQLLPTLVRESHAERLDLRPLTENDVRELIGIRYRLGPADTARLIAYLNDRAEGNPFFLGELLRTLQEEGTLRATDDGWMLDDLRQIRIPPLLRQIIDGRLARLGEEAQRLLGAAAVIGQEVPLTLWEVVADVDKETVLAIVERAAEARVMTETQDGRCARFVHALVRETLYEEMTPARRRALHRQVGEVFIMSSHPDPDAVASHFQRATDRRAVAWLIKAGAHAYRSWAWITAADRYEAALPLLGSADAPERARLLYYIAVLRQFVSPEAGITLLNEAIALAVQKDDQVLAACATLVRGALRCYVSDFRGGLLDLDVGATALDALPMTDIGRVRELDLTGTDLQEHNRRDALAAWFALLGRYEDARILGERLVIQSATMLSKSGYMSGVYRALGITYAGLGAPDNAREAYRRTSDDAHARNDQYTLAIISLDEFERVVIPYHADRVGQRHALVAKAAAAWNQAQGEYPGADITDFPELLLLALEGGWAKAHELAMIVRVTKTLPAIHRIATSVLGFLAHHQGDTDLAWALVGEALPLGPTTSPGDTRFLDAQIAQRLAVALALDAGNLITARSWLEAHDHWLSWSGAVYGRAEGHVGWAYYHCASGNPALAYQHATKALKHASAPRQPLALIAAHRLLGELDTEVRRFTDAETHLTASLALADTCAAPFERALTLLAQAELSVASGRREAAVALLQKVRTICTPLDAKPTLARADALTVRLLPHVASLYPALLTEREVQVLRLVAAGHTNRQIADTLFLSTRTIDVHLRNIFAKTGTENRAGATAFAFRHDLA